LKIGLTYDLKDNVEKELEHVAEDALEEYDSLETIETIAAALEALGHETLKLGGGVSFLRHIPDARVDFVFNIAEGRGIFRSREAQVPSVLEMLGIPYSGSDPACLCLCHDKPVAKQLVATAGIATPYWRLISSPAELEGYNWKEFPFPAFVKPAFEGSSKGVRTTSRVGSPAELRGAAAHLLSTYAQPVLIEEFIDGDEVTVGLMGNNPTRIVGIMRVVPRQKTPYFVYSLEIKRDWENLVTYECPAHFSPDLLKKIEKTSLAIFELLGCRDFARLDMRISTGGEPYFLEINPLPGLNHRSSDYPIMANLMGISYNSLISSILTAGLTRYRWFR
jgi:D-alanine-D-alanine ligase